MNSVNFKMALLLVVGLMIAFSLPCSQGYTNEQDVYAINTLYAALGSPPLPGWIPLGGDPCLGGWQGVECVLSNITAIVLNGANLGGQLGDTLENFTSIITIDLSDNHIGGSIPENLPLTMRRFFLSANQFTGSIPSSLSKLTLLSDMSINNNFLDGDLPDDFQSLTGLINLDLSFNNLSGQLPPSMENLSSLTTLHLQNNQFSGTLNVLQDLPLTDLNIENNLFSGPIPIKLLSIPNFKKDGNPFNTTIAPSLAPSSAPALPPSALIEAPVSSPDGPLSSIQNSGYERNNKSILRAVGYAAVAVAIIIIAVLVVLFCVKWRGRKEELEIIPKSRKVIEHKKSRETMSTANLVVPEHAVKKVPKDDSGSQKEHAIGISRTGLVVMPPLDEKVSVKTIIPTGKTERTLPQNLNPPSSVTSFSVATLQQYTHSFSEESLISEDRLGKVYLAQLSGGKFLAVIKFDNVVSNIMDNDDFLALVLRVSELRHANILHLEGYCAEFGQRLLVYNYFSKRTLYDVLHCGDDLKKSLSWDSRIQVALGAARALEYLHEVCQPPVIHQNFEAVNILVNDELAVRVSGCGMGSLLSSNSVTQMSGYMRALSSYDAPEVSESGSYTIRSDVYNFGVVMLELLTGRKPYDSSKAREERQLVRWASSQFYDINALSRIVDPSIDGKFPMKSLSRFADIINRCIQQAPEFRPLMSEVVQDLTSMIGDARRNENKSHI